MMEVEVVCFGGLRTMSTLQEANVNFEYPMEAMDERTYSCRSLPPVQLYEFTITLINASTGHRQTTPSASGRSWFDL